MRITGIIALLALSLFACQKVIDVDLNEANPQITIEANYTAEDSTVRVKVSLTSNYFSANTPPPVTSATVTIIDQAGNAVSVPHLGNGYYELPNYAPQFNSTYTMTVLYNGVQYTAKCYLQDPVQLQDITYDLAPDLFGFPGGYYVYLRFQDQPDTLNNYMIVLSRNGEELGNIQEWFFQDDLFTDGNFIERPLFGAEFFQLNDTIGMELRSIDQAVYDYYGELQSIASGGGGAAPANPTTNWDNKALGCFNAYGNTRRTVIIE